MRSRLVVAVLLVCAATFAHADFVNFTNDTTGAKNNGFQSVDSTNASFSNSIQPTSGLNLEDFGVQSFGNALSVGSDDKAMLVMDFTSNMQSINLWFGNDDPDNTSPGDAAVLTLYLLGVQVGQTSVVMNRDDIMNQQIGLGGITFDRATFSMDANHPGPNGVSEVVDDISFQQVPEPASLFLLGGGLMAGLKRLRK